jgi:DNA-binding transcriptional LysR family regulator
MTLDQLKIFAHVARTLNMRVASEQLHLTQPAVSAAISALERRYGTFLFDRVGRGLELSQAGRAFLPQAEAVLARAAEAERTLLDLAGLVRGEVRVAASQTVVTYWLPSRLARFVEAHPAITVPVAAGNTTHAVEQVIAGKADLGIVEGPIDSSLLRAQVVGSDRLSLYARPTHPLVGRKIGSKALRAALWILREEGSGTRDYLMSGLSRYGLSLKDLSVRLVLPSNGAVLEAVEAGELVAAVSDLAAGPRLKAGLIVRLDCTLPSRNFSMITHRERHLSRATSAFIGAIGNLKLSK